MRSHHPVPHTQWHKAGCRWDKGTIRRMPQSQASSVTTTRARSPPKKAPVSSGTAAQPGTHTDGRPWRVARHRGRARSGSSWTWHQSPRPGSRHKHQPRPRAGEDQGNCLLAPRDVELCLKAQSGSHREMEAGGGEGTRAVGTAECCSTRPQSQGSDTKLGTRDSGRGLYRRRQGWFWLPEATQLEAQHLHLAAPSKWCQEPPGTARPRGDTAQVPAWSHPTNRPQMALPGWRGCWWMPGARWSLTPTPWRNHVKPCTHPRISSEEMSDLGAKSSWAQPHMNSIF